MSKAITRCVTVSETNDKKIKAIQIRRMKIEDKAISYSSVINDVISEGLNHIQ